MLNKQSGLKLLLLMAIPVLFVCGCNRQSDEEKLLAKALKIHHEILTIDSHTDTPLWFVRGDFDLTQRHDAREHGSKLDFPRMIEGGLDGVFFAAFIGQGPRTPEGNQKAFDEMERIFDSIHAVINRVPQIAEIATTPEDAVRLKKEGKRAIFIGVENGYAIGNDLNLIRHFFNRGARYITLCHTVNNDICDSANDTTEFNGLSKFGKDVVKEMNRIGMMVDVSHISDKAFYDVIEISTAPVIASHSSARAVCDNPRNLTDEMLRKIAENGGVVQVCNLSSYVKETPPNVQRDSARNELRIKYNSFQDLTDDQMKAARQEWYAVNRKYPPNIATLSDYVDHIDHIVKVAGIDHVGIGTDFDGGGGVEGNFDVSEMPNITIELLRRGYSKVEIEKIWSGNLIRVMHEVEKVAKK